MTECVCVTERTCDRVCVCDSVLDTVFLLVLQPRTDLDSYLCDHEVLVCAVKGKLVLCVSLCKQAQVPRTGTGNAKSSTSCFI